MHLQVPQRSAHGSRRAKTQPRLKLSITELKHSYCSHATTRNLRLRSEMTFSAFSPTHLQCRLSVIIFKRISSARRGTQARALLLLWWKRSSRAGSKISTLRPWALKTLKTEWHKNHWRLCRSLLNKLMIRQSARTVLRSWQQHSQKCSRMLHQLLGTVSPRSSSWQPRT